MKRIICFLLMLIILTGCSNRLSKYSYEFIGAFDTFIQFIAYSESEEEFNRIGDKVRDRFMELHRVFDKYNNYEGINNIKTINDNAGIKPVKVCDEIAGLLEFSLEWSEKTGGKVNIALGPVLNLWHEKREDSLKKPENAILPDMQSLKDAFLISDAKDIVINREAGTVYLRKPVMSLDVGAIAKGYATEIIASELLRDGYSSFMISSGGNVKAVGKPTDNKRSKWGIGIQNPEAITNKTGVTDKILDIAYIEDVSVVSSGDYQRFYTVNGKSYHHIIDPDTLMPADNVRAVTVMTKDSGLGDILSTAVFLMTYKEGRDFVEGMDGLEALWVLNDNSIEYTEGMKEVLKEHGNATNK
jgi:thiamine biosynthesis lipoprotein